MSKGCYVVVNGTTKKVKKKYVVVDGVTKKVKKKYVVVENFAPVSLPTGYTQVEYVESNGNQYVDTGLKPSATDNKIVLSFTPTASTTGTILGSSAGASQDAITITTNSIWIAGASAFSKTYSTSSINSFELQVLNGTFTLSCNGETSTSSNSNNIPTTANYYIFAQNQGGSAIQNSSFKLYSAKIYKDNVLVRNYVPCKNASGVAGLYDTVNSSFVSSATSTALAAGAEQGNVTKLVYSAEVFGSYSGTYTVSQVTDTEGTLCDLYTITGSGTLVLANSARYWICGGGACGYGIGGEGGGGGRVNSGTIDAGSHIIAIGAGGNLNTSNGANTTIAASGNVTEATANGGGSNGDGGSGGGSGGINSTSYYNSGEGISTYPFGITSLYAHSAGGGGGNYYRNNDSYKSRKGGAGGSNGSNGGSSSDSTQLGYRAAGGQHGGGSGGTVGSAGVDVSSSITMAEVKVGLPASFYGSGGGGGAGLGSSGRAGGNGYQGVMYLLIPR